MNNLIENIFNYFNKHPKFPFESYYLDYDEYTAIHLMAITIVKSYILQDELNEWEYVSNYIDVRRSEPELRKSILSCVNKKREQVFFLSFYDLRENSDDFEAINIGLARDDFYGGKWESNAPIEEWYSIFEIYLNLRKLKNFQEIDELLKSYFYSKLSFDELDKIKHRFDVK